MTALSSHVAEVSAHSAVVTQQNSALVEENTAAAGALIDQTVKLKTLIAYFNVEDAALRNTTETTPCNPAVMSNTASIAA
ncbi:MAG: hypothetical protein ACR2RF_12310 [Geminicoccaceae bacterium]